MTFFQISDFKVTSAHFYTVPHRNRLFPNLIRFQILAFCLNFRNFVNILVIYPQNFKPTFSQILMPRLNAKNTTLKLYLKFRLSCLESFSSILENWKASTEGTNISISIKLRCFHCLGHSLSYRAKTAFKILLSGCNSVNVDNTKLGATSKSDWCCHITHGRHHEKSGI